VLALLQEQHAQRQQSTSAMIFGQTTVLGQELTVSALCVTKYVFYIFEYTFLKFLNFNLQQYGE